MAAKTSAVSVHPVKPDECQAHGHEYETQRCETRSLDLWSGVHGLLVGGDDADVEQSRQDEDQTGSSGGSYDAKDVSNVGNKDDQQVDCKQQTQGDGDVTEPVEGFPWKQQLQEGATDREQDHRYGQSDSHQDGQPNTQDQSVQEIHLTVGVEQLCFSVLVESQISKYGGEEVHDEHAQDGNVANILHSSLGGVSQFSVNGEHFRVTHKSKSQDGDGIRRLLVDGEEFGSACVLWGGCVHRVVAKHFQRASNVEFLVDDHREEEDHARERESTGVTEIPQVFHQGQREDDADSDDDNEVVSIHEPVVSGGCLAKKGLDDQR